MNIEKEPNFMELNEKIMSINIKTGVNEHEIFTNRLEESKEITKNLSNQIKNFPFNEDTKTKINTSLNKINNLKTDNVSSGDIINIMNYTKYLDSNFAIIYYRNNEQLNLDFLLALNSQKHLLNTTNVDLECFAFKCWDT
jgi:hypothetical protein